VTTVGRLRLAGGLLAVLLAGCGLADYEARMEDTQAQVDRFDEERRTLADPIEIPTRRMVAKDGKESKVPAINHPFFFRPPIGIRPTAEPDAVFGPAYRFPRTGSTGFTDVFLVFGNEPAAVFVDKVVKAFPRNIDPVQSSKFEVTVPNRFGPGAEQPLTFEVRDFNDAKANWTACARTEGNATTVVVFRMEKGKRKELEPAMKMSLSTLAVGPEADLVKKSYADRARAAK
jgi:hypothetical protein